MNLSYIKRLFVFSDADKDQSSDDNNESTPSRPRPSSGQPTTDLEQSWQDLNQRLSGFFSKKTGGGANKPSSPRPGTGMPKRPLPRIRVSALLAVGVLLWLASGFYIVKEGEVSVVTQFGRYYSTNQAGFHWRFPTPIQANTIVNVSQLRTIEIGFRNSDSGKVSREALMITDDQNIVDLQFVVQYRLSATGARDYLFANRNPDAAVVEAAETAMREVVGRKTMDFVLYEGRTQIANEVVKLMQHLMDKYHTGVLINNVAIQNAQPPEQVQAAFDDAVKAGQDRERQINEGEAYANSVVPLAQGTASRLLQEAKGYQQQVVATAQGDAARFNSIVQEYRKAPQVTRDRMYIDAMKQVFSNASKVYIDAKGGNNLLYLPLDKIIQGVSEDARKTSTVPDNANTNTAAPSNAKSSTDAAPAANANPSTDAAQSANSVPRGLTRDRTR